MNRSELLLVGMGGAGGKLTDTIMGLDQKFQGFFINTSITDLESLSKVDELIENYYCTSTNNGVGRDRERGKAYARQSGMIILDRLERYQQKVLYFIVALGGGSGSAEIEVLLDAIDRMNEEAVKYGEVGFDKIINVIGILPSRDSSTVILDNAINTWNKIISARCVNSMIFIDNDSYKEQIPDLSEREEYINEEFATLFDSIFDIPIDNGRAFDEGNLRNILLDKGCLHFYNLGDYSSIEEAFENIEASSPLAPMYHKAKNIELNPDGSKRVNCNYIGISFANEEYNQSYIFTKFSVNKDDEVYIGTNDEDNLLLISGLDAPISKMTEIKNEIESRNVAEKIIDIDEDDIIEVNVKSTTVKPHSFTQKKKTISSKSENSVGTTKKKKKRMKTGLFF